MCSRRMSRRIRRHRKRRRLRRFRRTRSRERESKSKTKHAKQNTPSSGTRSTRSHIAHGATTSCCAAYEPFAARGAATCGAAGANDTHSLPYARKDAHFLAPPFFFAAFFLLALLFAVAFALFAAFTAFCAYARARWTIGQRTDARGNCCVRDAHGLFVSRRRHRAHL